MSLHVVRAVGLCTVQDLGRRGHMHEAVPPGGALVPELLAIANRTANNPDPAPAIEVLGQLVVRAATDVLVAVDGVPRLLRAGEELTVSSGGRRCAYLAVRGGIATPRVLDGHGTLLCAELGAPLRAQESRAIGAAPETHATPPAFTDGTEIHVIAGPDHDAFAAGALALLTSAPYRILPSSDRVGTRLAGAVIPRAPAYRDASRPMVRGAIEVPRDGQPIVLGPEHPTTGGYPIIAVIASADLGRFFSIALGKAMRFIASR